MKEFSGYRLSGHQRDKTFCPINRGARLPEVSLYGKKSNRLEKVPAKGSLNLLHFFTTTFFHKYLHISFPDKNDSSAGEIYIFLGESFPTGYKMSSLSQIEMHSKKRLKIKCHH